MVGETEDVHDLAQDRDEGSSFSKGKINVFRLLYDRQLDEPVLIIGS
jgi:hypothetical protein